MAEVRIGRELWLHYRGTGGLARWRPTVVHGAYWANQPDRFGVPRILLNVVDLEVRQPKTFRADRVLELADAATGEIGSMHALLAGAGFHERALATALAHDGGPARTVEHGLSFTGPGGGLAGWHFHVPWPFHDALDLQPVRGELSQGLPPLYGFSAGDVLYDHPDARRLPWAEGLKRITRAVQVRAAQPDALDAERNVRPGAVTIELREVVDGALGRPRVIETTQAGLVALLRTGAAPARSPRGA